MVLLQISEPGQTSSSNPRRLAAGIDLGTTHSLVATVLFGNAETLADQQGRELLPSVVHYQRQGIEVGWQARQFAAQDPANTISSAKGMIGRSLSDIQTRYPNLPYRFHASENGLPMITTAYAIVNPIQVSSEVLKVLAARAEKVLGGPLDGVVITVPAYFDDAQRQGTKDAAKLAGLSVLRLLNEPTAAAIAYGLESQQQGIIGVYDFGGGTFDISILRLSKGVFEVLATGGDSALGGDDIDHLLADWIRTKAGLVDDHDTKLQRQLLDCAIQTKIALSEDQQTMIHFAGWQEIMTRDEFNLLIKPLVKKTIVATRRALKDANIELNEVSEVVMVGGSTRIPLVKNVVSEFFGRTLLASIDPESVVAIGAAIQADILVGNKPDADMLLLDVIPLSLGIETIGGMVEKIIPRNTTIPIVKAQEFTTFKDGQTAMMVHVLQGERELVQDCRSLANFVLRGIPPLPAGGAQIRVTFQVDADGLLSVTAMEKSTSVHSSIQVNPSYGLTGDEIANMLKDSVLHAQQDATDRALLEQKLSATRILESLLVALTEDGHLLSSEERVVIDQEMVNVRHHSQGNQSAEIKRAVKQLDDAAQEFATRRMNSSIRRAFMGQSIDEV